MLVVEDEERLATALQRGLHAEGFAVDIAATGPSQGWTSDAPPRAGVTPAPGFTLGTPAVR